MPYKHGVYGSQAATTDSLPPSGVATLPVYIGTAPVQQLTNPAAAVNTPILITSYEDAKAKIGYSDDWTTFTLCEAVYAHFKSRIQPIGPIIVINVFDPTKHTTAVTGTSVAITNGVGYLDAPAVLSSIAITGKVLGTDFTTEYEGERVKLKALTTLANPSSVNYSKMDVTKVTTADVIGSKTAAGVRSGLSVMELIYQTHNMIPTLLAAPGWSETKAVKEAMMTAAKGINGHWDAYVLADLDSKTSKTVASAVTWKSTNGYTDLGLKVGWPMAKVAGKVFHASTLIAVRMQQTDYAADNVPYVSPSNKQVDITSTVTGDGAAIVFDEQEANELNKNGITTFNFRSGIWVLWGPHGANYTYGAQMDPRDVFDASIRMMQYLSNSFQARYMANVDGPLNRSVVDTILNDAGTWLNSLVADGKMLHGKIVFNETSNPTSSIVEGDFVFDIQTTTTPVAKSLNFRLQYTTQGLNTLYGGASA
ncbi:phage tail sheath family protein [Gorillibacterium sp. sgz5001074]|uniref:phage tail sheath family protein n=1 Tax=Gorillibacterium sp. sgz5001074 TaxID=3446695 RepID=UPI003F67796E